MAGMPAYAADPPQRGFGSHFKLSLAAYSFNRFLPRRGDAASQKKATMTLEDFIEFCGEQQLDGCEPTAYYWPEDLDEKYLLKIKQRAFMLGLDISGTAIGNDFCLPPGPERDRQLAETRQWIDHAAVIGAPVIRIFAGKVARGDDEATAVQRAIEGINESLLYAAQRGVCLALENHGGITDTPEQMLRIIEGVKDSPWFGVNFDSGNFRTEDPYGDLEKIAPYAINAQIKASMHPKGKAPEPADFRRVLNILRHAGYRGYIVLEYEDEEDPKTAVPRLLNELRNLLH
jgi:sugar phosphate isomerase/epimerase